MVTLGSKILNLLPLNTLAEMVMTSDIGKKLLGPILKVYSKMHGVRSQGLLAVAAALWAASFLGWLPWETAKPLINDLLLISAPTMADKLVRILGLSESAQKRIDEASKGS